VYLDLPDQGAKVSGGEPLGEIESTKSVSDIYSPLSGEVAEVNADCRENPAAVNLDPYGNGWLLVITPDDPAQLDALMSSSDYETFLKSEAGE
jgi:glycine cleavage system H protein